jgi:hypothetical protein
MVQVEVVVLLVKMVHRELMAHLELEVHPVRLVVVVQLAHMVQAEVVEMMVLLV